MKILWLTNSDPNVAEDYLLPGLQRNGHRVEVRPWKRTFDIVRDPDRQGGHGYTTLLGGEIERHTVPRPDVIVVSRAWRERDYVEEVLEQHPGVPIAYFCGEDHHHAPPDWIEERSRLVFVAQCRPEIAVGKVVSLPCAARLDLLPPPCDDKPFTVLWGGKLSAGHGGRHAVLGPAITLGVIDDVASYAPWASWGRALSMARFSISIGGIQNAPVAGANVSYFEAGACGAALFAYPPGILIEPAIPGTRFFETPEELVTLCRAARAREFHPPAAVEQREFIREYHSHTARAAQMVAQLREIA